MGENFPFYLKIFHVSSTLITGFLPIQFLLFRLLLFVSYNTKIAFESLLSLAARFLSFKEDIRIQSSRQGRNLVFISLFVQRDISAE